MGSGGVEGWKGRGSKSSFLHGIRGASDSKEALDILDWSTGQIKRGDRLAMMLLCKRQGPHRPISSKPTK